MKKEDILGYVICVNMSATDNNKTFAGDQHVDYLGRNHTYIGHSGFVPYTTEKRAENAKKSWEKLYSKSETNGWKYTMCNVIPINKQDVRRLEEEFFARIQRDLELVGKKI